MAGCCYGKPTDAAVGIVFTNPHSLAPLNIPLHPTQLYAAAGGFGVTFVLLMIHARRSFEGQVLVWYLILYGTLSLFVEKYRNDGQALFPGSPLNVAQLLALLVLVGAIVMLFVRKSKRKETGSP
jgi:phosphatidylglycerol:prolipoprotein diacylglycerol transferase